MSAPLDEMPRRLRERSDQSNLIERIAGQAIRDLPRPRPLSATTLARIAAALDERAPRPRRRHAWAFVTAAFLMGIATAASAQRLDGLRQWLTRIVSLAPRPPERQASPHPSFRRPPAKPRPPVSANGEVVATAAPSQESASPEPALVLLAENPAPAADAREAHLREDRPTAGGKRLPSRPASRPWSPRAIESRPFQHPPASPTEGHEPASAIASATGRDVQLAYVDRGATPQPPSQAAAVPVVVPGVAAGGESSSPPTSATPESAAKPEPTPLPMLPPALPSRGAPSPSAPQAVAEAAAAVPAPSEGARPQATEHLTQAVQALRVEHSPKTALLLLDRHAEELERNSFGREALLLRVEATLALGRQAEALRLLDGAALTDATASRALLVIRGQLRAAANRCSEALADFGLVLGSARRPPKQALLGQARCKKQLGDGEGAKADLERYRLEFPTDRALDERKEPGTRP